MQEASGQPYQGSGDHPEHPALPIDAECVYLPACAGGLSPPSKQSPGTAFRLPQRVTFCRFAGDLLGLALLVVRWNQTGPRLSLVALSLLTLPLLLIFTKLVVLPDVAESVHQLLRPFTDMQGTTRVLTVGVLWIYATQ